MVSPPMVSVKVTRTPLEATGRAAIGEAGTGLGPGEVAVGRAAPQLVEGEALGEPDVRRSLSDLGRRTAYDVRCRIRRGVQHLGDEQHLRTGAELDQGVALGLERRHLR